MIGGFFMLYLQVPTTLAGIALVYVLSPLISILIQGETTLVQLIRL